MNPDQNKYPKTKPGNYALFRFHFYTKSSRYEIEESGTNFTELCKIQTTMRVALQLLGANYKCGKFSHFLAKYLEFTIP